MPNEVSFVGEWSLLLFLGILWAKIDILKNRGKYQLKYTFLITNNWNFPCRFLLFSFAYLWYNLDFAARIISLLIYLNLDSYAFLKFFYVGYDADMTTWLGMERAEGFYSPLKGFATKGAEALVDE